MIGGFAGLMKILLISWVDTIFFIPVFTGSFYRFLIRFFYPLSV